MTYEPGERILVKLTETTRWNADDSFTTTRHEVYSNGSSRHTETVERSDGSWESHEVDKAGSGATQHEKTQTSGTSRTAEGHEVKSTTRSETWAGGASQSSSTTRDENTGRTTRTESSDDGHGNRSSSVHVDDRSSSFMGRGPESESRSSTDARTGHTTTTTATSDENGRITSHVTVVDANGNVVEDSYYEPPPEPGHDADPLEGTEDSSTDSGQADPSAFNGDFEPAGPPDSDDDFDLAGPPDDYGSDSVTDDAYAAASDVGFDPAGPPDDLSHNGMDDDFSHDDSAGAFGDSHSDDTFSGTD